MPRKDRDISRTRLCDGCGGKATCTSFWRTLVKHWCCRCWAGWYQRRGSDGV